MKKYLNNNFSVQRLWLAISGRTALAGLLLVIAVYLFWAHYVQNYSDPVGFIGRALDWGARDGDHADRAPLYPMLLYGIILLVGIDWVFLSNIPFIVMTLGLLALISERVCRRPGESFSRGFMAGWTGIAAAVIFFLVRRNLLLQLVNPYREPVTFALMLLAVMVVWLSWDNQKWWLFAMAGFIVGLATGVREVSLLLVVPIGVWGAGQMLSERRIRFAPWSLMALGLMLGIAPLLWKNYAYSGQALVPAYSAARVSTYASTGSWDIPVPGMSLHYFSSVAWQTLQQTYQAYTLWGVAAFFAGIFFAVRERHKFILLFLLPAATTYFFFFCFYNRYLARYVVTSEIFALPILVYGVLGMARIAERFFTVRFGRVNVWTPRLFAMGIISYFAYLLLPLMFKGNATTKAWNLETIRQEISQAIEKPAYFMGHRHFCFRLSQMLGQSSYEYTRRFHHDHAQYDSLESRLRRQGAETLERFAEGHYYIDESNFSLARHWLQRTPVFNFDQLSVPFEWYGRPVSGNIYKVDLWNSHELHLHSEANRPRQAILMLDMGRPWDYPDRQHITGRELGRDAEYALTNAVQFIELREAPGTDPFAFEIASDQPLPPNASWALFGLNDEIWLAYGMAADHWAWNFAADALYPDRTIPYDAAQLYDQGMLQLPVYATPDRRVYAEVRMEFVQNNPYWSRQSHTVHLATEGYKGTWNLPDRRTQSNIFVPLDHGTGRLAMHELHLRTSLPSYETQNTYPFRAQCRDNGFVKLFDTRLHAVEEPRAFPVTVDVGAARDGVHVVRGFHHAEASNGRTSRWTDGRGEIRLALPVPDRSMFLRWTVLPHRPDLEDVAPTLTVNGHRIDSAQVRIVSGETRWLYEAEIKPEQIATRDAFNYFTLETSTWVPADHGRRSKDQRRLGVSVERFDVSYP